MIRVTRAEEDGNRATGYKIFIDGVYCGAIKVNETKEFEVENGSHAVYAGLYGISDDTPTVGSNTLHVDVKDSTVELEVGYAVVGWKKLLDLRPRDIVFWGNKAFLLREKSPTSPRQIRITRPKRKEEGFHDYWFPAYRVHIDGAFRGRLAPGATESFPVENGVHKVRVVMGWRRSNKLQVDVQDSIVELEVGITAEDLRSTTSLLNALYRTVLWFKYLWLREKESVDE